MFSCSRLLIIVLAILVSFSVLCIAQEHSDYHIFGTVLDVKEKPIADVKITLRDLESGKLFTFKSKQDGTFDQQFIPHAMYSLTIEKEGYITQRVDKLDFSAKAQETIEKKVDVHLLTLQEEEQIRLQKLEAETSKKVADTYKKGIEQFQAQQFDQAIASMQSVLKSSPDLWGAYHVMGSAYYLKRDCDSAIANFQKSTSLKKDNGEAYAFMGDCYVQKKDWASAISSYNSALQYKPDDLEIQCVVADLYRATEKEAEAEATVNRVLEAGKIADGTIDPKAGLCYKVNGEILLKKGKMKECIAALKKYLELRPDAPDKAQIAEMIQTLEQVK